MPWVSLFIYLRLGFTNFYDSDEFVYIIKCFKTGKTINYSFLWFLKLGQFSVYKVICSNLFESEERFVCNYDGLLAENITAQTCRPNWSYVYLVFEIFVLKQSIVKPALELTWSTLKQIINLNLSEKLKQNFLWSQPIVYWFCSEILFLDGGDAEFF